MLYVYFDPLVIVQACEDGQAKSEARSSFQGTGVHVHTHTHTTKSGVPYVCYLAGSKSQFLPLSPSQLAFSITAWGTPGLVLLGPS